MTPDLPQDVELQHLTAYSTSLAVGLLIGLERERNPAAKAGLRTFGLVALFGALTATLSQQVGSPWMLAAGLLIVGAMTIAAYYRDPSPDADPGTTTVIAIVVCYVLGALILYGFRTLGVMLGIVTTVLLYFKAELRGWTQRLTRRDLVSMLQFGALTFVVLPILPDRNFAPYDALNPHQVWLMVVLISGVSLAGYVALRIVGERYGAPLLGIFGGIASSTATTLVYARHGRDSEPMRQLAVVVILLANLVVMLRLAVVSAAVAPSILPVLLPVLGGGFVAGLAFAVFWWRRLGSGGTVVMPEMSNPTELPTAVTFGFVYALVLFLTAWLSDVAGTQGLFAVAAVSGFTDVDAITLSSLRLFDLGKLQPADAVAAIAIAISANVIFKLGVVFAVGGAALGRRTAAGLLLVAGGALGALLFLPR